MDDQGANSLWLEWMQSWLEDARLKNLKSATTLKKACDSLKSCPLPMTHPSEAQALNGFGPKTCEKLKKKLREHCEENGLPMPKRKSRKRMSENLEEIAVDMTPAKKPRKAAKAYVPQLRSGPYAILLALASIGDSECVSKQQLIEMAQPHCDSSFVAPKDTASYHTAWSSMKTLLNKDLVKERRGPQKRYELTDDGWDVANKMKKVDIGDQEGSEAERAPEITIPARAPNRRNPAQDEEQRADTVHIRKEAISRFKAPPPAPVDDDLAGPSLSRESTKQPPPLIDHINLDPTVCQPALPGHRLGGDVTDRYGTIRSSTADRAPKANADAFLPPLLARNGDQHLEDDARLAARLQAEEDGHTKNADSGVGFVELLSSSSPLAAPSAPPCVETVNPRINQRPVLGDSAPPRSPSLHPDQPTLRPPPAAFTPPTFQPITLAPSTFTIELILDNREIRSREDRSYIETQLLRNHSIRPLIRSLPLGDFFWVAKIHPPSLLSSRYGEEGDLVALDYIVERKRLDDLISSIKDGRFREQKFRLRRSGSRNVVYLIEEIGISQEVKSKYWAAMQTAVASTQVVDGFSVKRTRGLDESIRYLARMTRLLKSIYESKPLTLIPSSALAPKTYTPLLTHLRATQPAISHNITYSSFASLASKSENRTLRDVFLQMLMTTRTLTPLKALEIQKHYTTPRALVAAFAACKDQQERDRMVEKALDRGGVVVGRAKVGKQLSKAVAEMWGGA